MELVTLFREKMPLNSGDLFTNTIFQAPKHFVIFYLYLTLLHADLCLPKSHDNLNMISITNMS
jgi:hypothetical protein